MDADWIPTPWSKTFKQQVGGELEHAWTLQFNYSMTEDLTLAEIEGGWVIYRRTVLGRFRCGSCTERWDSDTAELYFRYRLRSDEKTYKGTIIMMPIRQVCPSCGKGSRKPWFSQDEVQDTLLKLFKTIRDKYKTHCETCEYRIHHQNE